MLQLIEDVCEPGAEPLREILAPLDAPKHPHARLLLENWRQRELDFTIGRDIPARALGAVLRYLAVIDPVAGTDDYRVRLAGMAWLRRFGSDVTGATLSRLYEGLELEAWRRLLREAIDGGEPACRDARVLGDNGLKLHYEILALPALASDGKTGCLMAGLFHYDWH